MAPSPPREQRHPFLRHQGLKYSNQDIAAFKERLERIHDKDLLGPPPSYTLIKDPVLRLCHRMMAHSIAGPARKEGDAGGVAEEAPVAPKGGNEDEKIPQAVPPPPTTQ
nr:hypothetical protein [Tanacetum cinerariifolium]